MKTAARQSGKGSLALALLMIGIGSGWLLTELEIGPQINWTWTAVLMVTGVLAFVLSGGVDKCSIVLGPLLLMGGLLSIARQAGYLAERIEMPILVIVAGGLFLAAQSSRIPVPGWFDASPGTTPDGSR